MKTIAKRISQLQTNTIYFTLLIALLCIGCSKNKPNYGDLTPPSITWTVKTASTSASVNYTGTTTFIAKLGETYTVTGCADDDGGLKESSSSSEMFYQCQDGPLAQNVGPSLGILTKTPISLDADGNAEIRSCRFYNSITISPTCGGSFTFSNGYTKFRFAATNYGNKSVNAVLTAIYTN